MPSNAGFSAQRGFYGPASYDGAAIEKNRFDHLADSEETVRKLPWGLCRHPLHRVVKLAVATAHIASVTYSNVR